MKSYFSRLFVIAASAFLLPLNAFANPFTVDFCIEKFDDDICIGLNLDRDRIGVLEGKTTLSDVFDVGGCNNLDVAKSDGVGGWFCAVDEDTDTNTDTSAATECDGNEVLNGNGDCVLHAGGTVSLDDLFARTLVVNPVGSATDNGTELLDALAFLGTVAPLPSATNPWLIKIEPGIYDVGATSVQMLPYVDIEGSGQGVTEITGSVDGSPADNPAVVTMADHTEIRHVTVTNIGGIPASIAITAKGGIVAVSDVTAQAFNSGAGAIGLLSHFCVSNGESPTCTKLTMTNVTATAEDLTGGAQGVNVDNSFIVATNVTATGITATGIGVGFVINFGTTASVRNSVLTGPTVSISVIAGSGSSLNVAHSQLIGPISPLSLGGGPPTCFGTYDANLNPEACIVDP